MFVENKYKPSIILHESMLDKYLYVVAFEGLQPASVRFYNTENHIITEPLVYQNGIAIFEPTGINFEILFNIYEGARGDIEIKEALLDSSLKVKTTPK